MRRFTLYLTTLLIEVVVAVVRAGILFFLLSLIWFFVWALLTATSVMSLVDLDSAGGVLQEMGGQLIIILSVVIVFRPILWSIFAMLGYDGGGEFTAAALGAREPSQREAKIITQALKWVVDHHPGDPIGFTKIYVIDSMREVAYSVGTCLYVSSQAIYPVDRHLKVLIAHELGHLQNGDSGMVLALRRFIFPVMNYFMPMGADSRTQEMMIMRQIQDFTTERQGTEPLGSQIVAPQLIQSAASEQFFSMANAVLHFNFALAGGGIGVLLTSRAWTNYMREQDYLADKFVFEAGLKNELIEFLEETRHFDNAMPFLTNWRPASELRIDYIYHLDNPQTVESPVHVAAGGAATGSNNSFMYVVGKNLSKLLPGFVVKFIESMFIPIIIVTFLLLVTWLFTR